MRIVDKANLLCEVLTKEMASAKGDKFLSKDIALIDQKILDAVRLIFHSKGHSVDFTIERAHVCDKPVRKFEISKLPIHEPIKTLAFESLYWEKFSHVGTVDALYSYLLDKMGDKITYQTENLNQLFSVNTNLLSEDVLTDVMKRFQTKNNWYVEKLHNYHTTETNLLINKNKSAKGAEHDAYDPAVIFGSR